MFDLPPRRQHPAWIFLSAVRQLRSLALPLIVLLFSGGRQGGWGFLAFGAVAVLLGVVGRGFAWWQFRYEVTGGELRVRSGLLARRERFVPLERIQAVDINETPLQRLLGVVGVRIETAAGGAAGSDVAIDALARRDAETLRARLAVARRDHPPAAEVRAPDGSAPPSEATAPAPNAALGAPTGVLIRRLTPGELLTAGATSGQIAPALAVIGFAVQIADDVLPEAMWRRIVTSLPGVTILGLATVVGFVALVAWMLAIVGTALTFGNFELRRDGDRLHVAYGLLERRRRSIPLARIQAVSVGEGLLRQPFGLAALRFESAGYGKDTAESGVLFPLLRRSEVPALLAAVAPSFAAPLEPATLAPPPPRARARYVVPAVLPALVLTAIAVALGAFVPGLRWWWGLAPLALVPVAALHGWLRFRDTGWALAADDLFVARAGGIERTTSIVPRRRVQHRSSTANFFQRRASLASLTTAVASGGAGGRVRLDHLDAAVAADLLHRLGPPAPTPAAPAVPEPRGTPVPARAASEFAEG